MKLRRVRSSHGGDFTLWCTEIIEVNYHIANTIRNYNFCKTRFLKNTPRPAVFFFFSDWIEGNLSIGHLYRK